jgi:hypothetical protein
MGGLLRIDSGLGLLILEDARFAFFNLYESCLEALGVPLLVVGGFEPVFAHYGSGEDAIISSDSSLS